MSGTLRVRLKLPDSAPDPQPEHAATTGTDMKNAAKPAGAEGLYDPRYEHDACGVAMVARLDNRPTHEVIGRALEALDNLEHRGAEGADVRTGDGAGILVQLPDAFFRGVAGVELPEPGRYGVAMCFLPQDPVLRTKLEALLELNVRVEGQRVLGWRDVPVDQTHIGETANRSRPYIKQLFVGAGPGFDADQDAFERKLYVIRRIVELAAGPDFYTPSFSSRTLVYKGMLISHQLRGCFPDLQDERFASAMALVHSRFSTNTFPSWELAHPFRAIAHNGEINTLMGNVNWMRARESQLASELFGLDLQKVMPIVRPGNSDSATFDNVLELLMLAGRSLPHAIMMMIPEAYQDRDDLSDELKGFYAFHSCLMEPWDGPAAVTFTDGRVVGATLDRNGLRPGRWVETRDGHVILGSEAGMLGIRPENVLRLGRLAPGKLFLVDLEQGRIVEDSEVKAQVSTQAPYAQWHRENVVRFDDLEPVRPTLTGVLPTRRRQLAFGYTQEDLRVLMAPMAQKGEEPIGSMGNDAALAVLSDRRPPLFSYFKQLFAQVTNPPIDPIREAVVMSLGTGVGAEQNLLDETPLHAHQLVMSQPILRNLELETLREVASSIFRAHTIDITWPIVEGPDGLCARLATVCDEAHDALAVGVNVLILSDRRVGPDRAPIPSLLAVAAVHHHLVREGTRLKAGLVLESGEPREVHHFATLIGYGASAINPYLMLDTVAELARDGWIDGNSDPDEAERKTVKGLGKGLLKTISKMGISTVQSYCGAQIFEAVGLDKELVERHFTGTASRIGGITLDVLARETLDRHAQAWPGGHDDLLPVGGIYAWRRDGEHHMWNPETIALLQHAVRRAGEAANGRPAPDGDAQEKYDEYARLVNADAARRATLRGLLTFRTDQAPGADRRGRAGQGDRPALRDGRDVARLDLHRGARDARGGDEPPRRQVEHGRGRGGPAPLHARPQRRQPPLGDQAGRVGALRRDDQLPGQRRPAADQDGPGRQARRGRPAPRPQGRQVHRLGAPHDARRGAHLAAAPPRHLLHRGPQAAHLRPALLQPVGAGVGEARGRGRRGHRRRRRGQGQRRPRPHLGPRRRHRRIAAQLDPGGGRAMGDRPGRDAADAAAQRPALADRRADRRPAEDGPRRGDRRDAGRRRVRLLDRAADRDGLHHDARLPPEHLPGGHRDAGPRAAQALRGPARARRQLLLLRGRGAAGDHGLAGHPHGGRAHRAQRPAAGRRGDRALEGPRRRPHADPAPAAAAGGHAAAPHQPAARGARQRAGLGPHPPGRARRSTARAPSRSRRRSATSTAASAACSPAGSPSCTAPRGCPRTASRSSCTARPGRRSAAGWRRA